MTRMTDEEAWSRNAAMVNSLSWAAQRDFWREEAERARSEEARLLKEVADKDATIKTLADALDRARTEIRKPKRVWKAYLESHIYTALRLAGRAP
jgi:ATP-dependent Clp protease ATP-binding subunit ClpA